MGSGEEGGMTLASLADLGWDDDDPVVEDPQPKNVRRMPSMLYTNPSVDKSVPSHARHVADVDGEIRDVIAKVAPLRTRQLYPCDMPVHDDSYVKVRAVFERILTSDFRPVKTTMKKSITEKALEMPLRGSYYQCLPLFNDPKVHIAILDVTMGKELLHMYQANGNVRLSCHVHMILRGAAPRSKHRLEWWEGCTYEGRLHVHPYDELPTGVPDGERWVFSRVFCDLTVGYWLATDAKRAAMFAWLQNHLAVDGEFLGTYVNPESVRHLELKARGLESNLGVVEFRAPSGEWHHGSVIVRVAGQAFEDGRVPYGAVQAECRRVGFSLGTPGLKYMERYAGWETPSKFKRFIRTAEVSCVDILYIRRPSMLLCDPLPIKSTWRAALGPLPRSGVVLREGQERTISWNFPQNKGCALGIKDVYFTRPDDQLLAFKQDGISGKLIIIDRVARLFVAHRAGDVVYECAVEYSGCVLAQVEVLTGGSGIARVWVLDVYECPGMRETDDFLSRYERGWKLISKFKLPDVYPQEWVRYSPLVFHTMASQCGRSGREGVVFQSRRAPRGCFENFLGSARYWKPPDRLTIDKAVGDRVFEFYLDGGRGRERVDKKIGNTPGQIEEVKSALKFGEIVSLLDTSDFDEYNVDRLVSCMVEESLDVPPDVAVTLMHPNKGRGPIHAALVERGVVSNELEASHVLARYGSIIEELTNDANLRLVRKASSLEWYDLEVASSSAGGGVTSLSALVEEDWCDLPVYD